MTMNKSIIAGMVALVGAVSLTQGQALARPAHDNWHIYYSDATFKTVVGEEQILSCYGRGSGLTGQRSDFYKVEGSACNVGGQDPPIECVVCGYQQSDDGGSAKYVCVFTWCPVEI
jgi:hypothetical protein